ncbi:hypothetical protein BKA69DRAFT_1129883 [Paraphysoderma sedebokerense]|nr:hypothetical protein BKA69DRAFT_1129883 [Paraphysoderma sedebokerense]
MYGHLQVKLELIVRDNVPGIDDPYFSSVKPLGDRQLTMPYGSTCIILPFETDFKAIEVEMHLGQTSG